MKPCDKRNELAVLFLEIIAQRDISRAMRQIISRHWAGVDVIDQPMKERITIEARDAADSAQRLLEQMLVVGQTHAPLCAGSQDYIDAAHLEAKEARYHAMIIAAAML